MSNWDYYRDCGTDDYGSEFEWGDIDRAEDEWYREQEMQWMPTAEEIREEKEYLLKSAAKENSRRINEEFKERLPGYRVTLALLALEGRRKPIG